MATTRLQDREMQNSSVLIFGGRSEEKLVSVASGQNLAARFEFGELWFIAPSGAVHQIAPSDLAKHERAFEVQYVPTAPAIGASLEQCLPKLKGKTVFLGLHGTEGEDGGFQAMFEREKIAFTGSGAQSSRDCFDKLKAKAIVQKHGIKVAAELRLSKSDPRALQSGLEAFLASHGTIVIKPVASGSSFGLKIVSDRSALDSAVKGILDSQYDLFMAESFVTGRELTVGVLETGTATDSLPPSEVRVDDGRSFDYAGKYLGKGTLELTPAEISPAETKAAQKVALDAHKALGCFGYTRTDMILQKDGSMVYLETNTLPGLSKASFIPQQLTAAGISIPDFIKGQLALAQKRH